MVSKKFALMTIIISVLLVGTVTLAFSYAYWNVTKTQEGVNVVESGCLKLEIIDEKNAINLLNAYPITDEEAETNTPYTFTVSNTCTINATYSVNIELLEGTTLSSEYVAIKVDSNKKSLLNKLEPADMQEENSIEARKLSEGILGPGEKETYNVNVWMDERVTLDNDAQNKNFNAKIVVVANPIELDSIYAISGYFLNDNDQPIPNAYLAVFSDTIHVVKTDLYGRVFVSGLERGVHEIYYLNSIDPTNMTKAEIMNSAEEEVDVATNHKGDIVFKDLNYRITDLKVRNLVENPLATYQITLNPDNGDEVMTKEVTENKLYGQLPTPTKTGYNFNGWYHGDKLINSQIIVIEKEPHELIARWSANTYTVTFNANGGALVDSNDLTRQVAYNTTYGTLPQATRDGYDLVGWFTNDGIQISNLTVYKTLDNITLYAHWQPQAFSINYDLDGGTATNPPSYTPETDTFILNNPTKTGYTFRGWTGSNGTIPDKVISITKGSTGNREYKANWDAAGYSISYDLDGGTASNPSSYNIESDAFTLNNPTRTGYTFNGWSGTGLSSNSTSVTIPKGSTGNRSYKANWTPITYYISYTLNGGSASNPGSYNIEHDTIVLNAPTRAGYAFKGWTGSNGSTPQTNVTIPKGSTGDKTYVANWESTKPKSGVYTLEYDANNNKKAEYGDKICVGETNTQCFYVLAVEGNNLRLLSEWNLNVGSNTDDTVSKGIQYYTIRDYSSGNYRYGGVFFLTYPTGVTTNYWTASDEVSLTHERNNVYQYLTGYKSILETTYGVTMTGTEPITLIRASDIEKIYNTEKGTTGQKLTFNRSNYIMMDSWAPSWLYQTSYFTRSAYSTDALIYIDNNAMYMYMSGIGLKTGVRPVIVINNPFP